MTTNKFDDILVAMFNFGIFIAIVFGIAVMVIVYSGAGFVEGGQPMFMVAIIGTFIGFGMMALAFIFGAMKYYGMLLINKIRGKK